MVDKIDKHILFELEKDARIAHSQLAKKVNRSKDTVRYRIDKLEEQGIITGYRTWIDYTKLGFRTATVYLNLLNKPARKQQLVADVRSDPRAYWLGVAEGAWNVGVTYFIESNQDLFEIKNQLLSEYADLIVDSRLTSLASLRVHEKTFLVDTDPSPIVFSEGVEHVELDGVDKDVLRALYGDSTISLTQLARDIDSTIDVVRYRMQKLEEADVVVRYSIYIDYRKLGYELFKAFLYLRSYDQQQIADVMEYARRSDTIINIVQQIAPWDYEFVIFAESFDAYLSTMDELTQIHPELFSRYETAIMSQDIIYPCEQPNF